MAKIQRSCQDKWEANPAQVTSSFWFSLPSWSSGSTYNSPICGLGWRLQSSISHSSHSGKATLDLFWDPHPCSKLDLGELVVSLQILDKDGSEVYQKTLEGLCMSGGARSLCSDCTVARKRQIEVILSVLFDSSTGLSFPSSPYPRANDFLLELMHASLTRPSPADTKLYLYSARIGHRATRPKPLFVNSDTLRNSSIYWETMLSVTGFKRGVRGDLFVDDPEAIQKLSSDEYDYNSDSDLESISDDPDVEEKRIVKMDKQSVDEDTEKLKTHPASQTQELQQVKAACFSYAVNGTAHRTLEAYIAYVYTGEVKFDMLRSTRRSNQPRDTWKNWNGDIKCSPKSLYRLADFIGIPILKAQARISIEQGLTKENIVTELFSYFTSRYDEIIELETNFLINNFSDEVEHAFNTVLLSKEFHPRTLVFALKMLRGGDVKTAWEMVNSTAVA